jgi:hypothetical protein
MPSNRRVPFFCATLLAMTGIAFAGPATQPAELAPVQHGAAATDSGKYLRFVDQGAGGRLETAETVFVNDQGTVVRLIAAVHIGEGSYFKGLSDSFRQRDAVLYELVKPKDVDVPRPGQESTSAIGTLQRMLKDTLNLEFQLDQIDYSAPNFIHADLDAETFEKMQAERGENFATLMLQQLMKAMSQPQGAGGLPAQDINQELEELVKTFTRPDMERQFKRLIARQLGTMEEHALGLDGPGGSVILTERNKAAVRVLENVLKDGKRDIAIFYGAAHMPDLAERLKTMGFKPVATEWRMAWDLTIRYDEPSAVEKLLMELIRGMDDGTPGR